MTALLHYCITELLHQITSITRRYAENGFNDTENLPQRLDALISNGGVNVYIRNYLICRMFPSYSHDLLLYQYLFVGLTFDILL